MQTPKAKDGPLKDVTVKVAQALGTMLNRKLKDGGYDKKQACKRLCWQVQQLATAHMFFLAATSSPAAGVQDTIEDLDKECIAVVDDVFSSLDRKGPLKPHELCKLGHTVQSTMGRIDEESSEYYAALAQISTNMRKVHLSPRPSCTHNSVVGVTGEQGSALRETRCEKPVR